MDDTNSTVFSNSDAPIPVIRVDMASESQSQSRSHTPSKREALLNAIPSEKLKNKLESLKRDESPGRLQDKLMTMLLNQIIPTDDSEESDQVRPVDRRSRKYVDRPNFSIPTMSYNFRRFNSRIGVAFVFQNRMIRLFTWKTPTHTLSFLAIYTFICLDPALIAVLPLAATLFLVMVPAFLTRHPPPPTSLPTELYPLSGPPLAPPRTVKPAADLSKDFFRNMRDLQNCMEDFSRVHDSVIAWLAPPTNFSNEALSSAIFLILFLITCAGFIFAHLIPWRAISLIGGWVAVCAGHPSFQKFMEATEADKFAETQDVQARSWLLSFAAGDIDLSSSPETREVEIFELQHRDPWSEDAEWEPWLFSPGSWAPLSPARVSGERPKGSRFFEDVQPPNGWFWADKKWSLDLLSREWVEERFVTGVEVEVEGERWVTDISYGEEEAAEGNSRNGPTRKKGKEKVVSWEEGTGLGKGKVGEWRRRRWVRSVQRKTMEEDKVAGSGWGN